MRDFKSPRGNREVKAHEYVPAKSEPAFLKLLDALASHFGGEKKACHELGITHSQIWKVRNGQSHMLAKDAAKILAAYKRIKQVSHV